MATNVIRFKNGEEISWGVLTGARVRKLPGEWGTTTAEILAHREELADVDGPLIEISEVELLSPITTPCRIYCQGMNYGEHVQQGGIKGDRGFNTFFNKSSASVTGPRGAIVKPKHVKLLDYELELGLVIGSEIRSEQSFETRELSDVVAGIVIGNDVTARDVQLPQGQYFKGKSYRTFCPLGPYLCLLDRDELRYLDELQLTLSVNGQTRQNDSTRSMIFKPAETLSELSQFADLHVGDVVLTGTPGGCAVRAPTSKLLLLAARLMPEEMKWRIFIKKQLAVEDYLRAGDVVRSRIVSQDRSIDLGEQVHHVVE